MKFWLISFWLICVFLIRALGQVTDDDRRGFDDLRPILIDVDGDGREDRIEPRTYRTYRKRAGKRLPLSRVKNWITFDLTTSKGVTVRSFFTYNYGTAENGGSYWVYALIPAEDVNKDGRVDLMFYSGDDTTDESVILVNRGTRFTVLSRKRSDSGDW